MYYRMRFPTIQPMYTAMSQANRLLLRIYLHFEAQGGSILDYTLLPTLLDLLVSLPGHKPTIGFLKLTCSVVPITTTQDLLFHYRNISIALPKGGKDYPLCGTYEAYHGSNCLSSLGKMEPFPQDINIRMILEEKGSLKKRELSTDISQ